jgi:hypothetical protein
MLKVSRLVVATLLICAVTSWAQSQVATVTSSTPFTLRGETVTPGQGVPSWPILTGDTLRAGSAPAIVTFPDGSVLTLEPGSEATVAFVNGIPVFHLLKGVARYSLKSASAVQLMEGSQTVTPKGLTGILTAGGSRAAAAAGSSGGWWTPGHTALVIAGAGAIAGLGYGIGEATKAGTSVSPSQ